MKKEQEEDENAGGTRQEEEYATTVRSQLSVAYCFLRVLYFLAISKSDVYTHITAQKQRNRAKRKLRKWLLCHVGVARCLTVCVCESSRDECERNAGRPCMCAVLYSA